MVLTNAFDGAGAVAVVSVLVFRTGRWMTARA
jgi:hypothetical protein